MRRRWRLAAFEGYEGGEGGKKSKRTTEMEMRAVRSREWEEAVGVVNEKAVRRLRFSASFRRRALFREAWADDQRT